MAVVASFGGADMVAPVYVVAKREFAGNWEYLLDEAIFTAPPHPAWSGAALISREGKLVGVGSLIVGDATVRDRREDARQHVRADRPRWRRSSPICWPTGHAAGAGRPWLGVNADELHGRLIVTRVTPRRPGARRPGCTRGDIIVSVNGEQPKTLADFYRKVWAQGDAGTTIPLDVLQDSACAASTSSRSTGSTSSS